MTPDDLQRLWQSQDDDDVDALPSPSVDVLVAAAQTRRRRGWWPVFVNSVVLGLAIVWYAAAMSTGLLEAPPLLVASAHAVLACALGAAVFSVRTHRLAARVLQASSAVDDVVSQHFAPLLSSLRRTQWGTAFTLLVAVQLAVLSLLLLAFGGSLDFVAIAVGVVVVLGLGWAQLEHLSMPITRLVVDARDTARDDDHLPTPLTRTAAVSTKTELPRTTTPSSSSSSSSSPVILATVPGSSAAPSRHFGSTPGHSLGVLSDSERRSWRVVVGLVAIAVVPLLIDALAVLGLQWGPQPTVSSYGLTVHVPLLHRVLPYLPIAVALLASLLTPLAFLVGRDVVDRRFAGRFTWLVLMPFLGVPAVLSALGLALGDDLNAHLWGYSLTSSSVVGFVDGTCTDECATFFVFTCIASVGRLLRFFAVVVVAVGLRRLVGAGRLRLSVSAVLAMQVLAWIATSWLPSPAGWRGLVDVVVGVMLVLIAVLSQPAFEADL